MPPATPARCKDSAPGFSFPAVARKKVTAAFDGGRLTSDGGALLLAQAACEMAICGRLAVCIAGSAGSFAGGSGIPKTTVLALAEFATLRLPLLKVADRVIEAVSRIRVVFSSACPDANTLKAIVVALK